MRPTAVLAALAPPLLLVAAVALITGWQLPRLPFASTFPVTPIGLLTGGYERLAGVPTRCDLADLHPLRAAGYAAVFFMTVALEAPLYALALRPLPPLRRALVLLWANVATHPVVFFALPCAFAEYRPFALAAEVFAPATEAVIVAVVLRGAGRRARALGALAVVAANLLSWQLGGLAYAW